MKFIKIILCVMMASVAAFAELDTTSTEYFLYIYFFNQQQEVGARLAFSNDGVNFVNYNNGEAVITPKIAQGETPLMRDPNTWYDSTTGLFHLIWTTAWNQDNIGHATSTDLLDWSEQEYIYVGKKIDGCRTCWAPELYHDDLKDSIMIFWSTERGAIGKEAFYCMTKDFITFTDPKVYFAPKNALGEVCNVIDETILKVAEGKYYMFFKDEREAMVAGKISKNIHYAIGATPQGPWEKGPWDEMSKPISDPGNEGPTAIIMDDEVWVYFDPYNRHESTDRIRIASLSDLQGDGYPPDSVWRKGPVMKLEDGSDFIPSHGSISRVPREVVMKVLYDVPMVRDTGNGNNGNIPKKEYPLGKRNRGCGTGVGLAFFPPIVWKMTRRRRRKRRNAI